MEVKYIISALNELLSRIVTLTKKIESLEKEVGELRRVYDAQS